MENKKRSQTIKAPSSNKLASIIAKGMEDKKAQSIEMIDIRKSSSVCNYVVLATGNSAPQVSAIADGIDEALIKAGIKPARWQGKNDSNWKILDMINVVAHVMGEEERQKYALEKLWEKSGVTYHI